MISAGADNAYAIITGVGALKSLEALLAQAETNTGGQKDPRSFQGSDVRGRTKFAPLASLAQSKTSPPQQPRPTDLHRLGISPRWCPRRITDDVVADGEQGTYQNSNRCFFSAPATAFARTTRVTPLATPN